MPLTEFAFCGILREITDPRREGIPFALDTDRVDLNNPRKIYVGETLTYRFGGQFPIEEYEELGTVDPGICQFTIVSVRDFIRAEDNEVRDYWIKCLTDRETPADFAAYRRASPYVWFIGKTCGGRYRCRATLLAHTTGGEIDSLIIDSGAFVGQPRKRNIDEKNAIEMVASMNLE